MCSSDLRAGRSGCAWQATASDAPCAVGESSHKEGGTHALALGGYWAGYSANVCVVALSLLGSLAMPVCSISRLPKGQGSGT